MMIDEMSDGRGLLKKGALVDSSDGALIYCLVAIAKGGTSKIAQLSKGGNG